MYMLNKNMLFGKYVFNVNNENAETFCRTFSELYGCDYKRIDHIVREAISRYDSEACIRYHSVINWFRYSSCSCYQGQGFIVVNAMDLFAVMEEEEFEASDMDISVMM